MKRSLSAALAIIATVCGSTFAHADLDSLLGDWTEAASQDAGSDHNGSDLTLAPAIEGMAEVDSNFSVDFDGGDSLRSSGPKPAAPAMPPKTLASAHAHGTPQPVARQAPAQYAPMRTHAPVLAVNGFQVSGPRSNPYYTPGCPSCDCGNSSCQGGGCRGGGCLGGGCGEIVPREQICHLEGESECRPHRRPLLPPPTTMLQLFRSKNTWSTVWAGYADETRDRVRNKSPHLNGTWNACDDGGVIEPGCNQCGPGCSGCGG